MSRISLCSLLSLALAAAAIACVDTKDAAQKAAMAIMSGPPKPDVLPAVLNKELPFQYPAALYAKKIQGNVTLRIFIDSLGIVHGDSTAVVETSGYPALDSAAIRGAEVLRFSPAKLQGRPISVPILFPVYFRHPDASPLPGDTILKRGPGTRDRGPGTATKPNSGGKP
jgi:protein TonB